MTTHPSLSLEVLERAVGGEAAAIRSVTRLQPAGGAGDKVFPPTYAVEKGALRYATELRRIDGREVETVLLDSVPSQANRMEEALLAAWDEQRAHFPVIAVDFSDAEGVGDLDRITTLQAPHRIADALLRDSIDEQGRFFRDTDAGRAFTDSSPTNATAVYQYCPTALVFGVWDSTGPRGGLGTKFQRVLISEVVGIGVLAGVKTCSRIDPAAIGSNVPVFHRKDNKEDWTIREDEALKDKGKLVPFSRKGAEGRGKPSAINHSNVAPTIDTTSGGVTLDYAQQTVVLSLSGLRRLRFQTDVEGKRLDRDGRVPAECAARTALAALALNAVVLQRSRGYDLRSRSALVPDPGGPLVLEVLPVDGGEPVRHSMTTADAQALLARAHEKAKRMGFGWEREPLRLKPAPKLADLIRKSRELAAAGEGSEEGGG
ncbi:MAG: type I-U CRISPR-associated protein Cas7 [Myxococcales bacterium]|nr:type I-U CRISPR-associated protein Cas7 [Myxococcales bacterium]